MSCHENTVYEERLIEEFFEEFGRLPTDAEIEAMWNSVE